MTGRRRSAAGVAGAVLAALFVGCGPAPAPAVPAPAVTAVATAAPALTTTAAAQAGPASSLPKLHPCVPDFIQKELHACAPGAEAADYSAVANALTAMTAAGPVGPRPKETKPVPRELSALEEKAASTARAFLCAGGSGELDDERATTAFDLGRLYLVANHFEEAAVFLHDVTGLDPEKHAEVEYAARFLLDAARPLAESRPECVTIVKELAAAVEAHVCQGPGADQRAETCAALRAPR